MDDIYVQLEIESPQHGRALAFGDENIINGDGKEVGFGIYKKGKKLNKTEKEEDTLIAYIPQQRIVWAFVEIVKRSSILAMLGSGSHKGNSFDHLIATALKEMNAAVDFKDE